MTRAPLAGGRGHGSAMGKNNTTINGWATGQQRDRGRIDAHGGEQSNFSIFSLTDEVHCIPTR